MTSTSFQIPNVSKVWERCEARRGELLIADAKRGRCVVHKLMKEIRWNYCEKMNHFENVLNIKIEYDEKKYLANTKQKHICLETLALERLTVISFWSLLFKTATNRHAGAYMTGCKKASNLFFMQLVNNKYQEWDKILHFEKNQTLP